MRGYGRSSSPSRATDYALEPIAADMLELLAALGRERAVWIGHDWGSPVVWSLAAHHPDRCLAVANLCVPYIPAGFALPNLVALVDRRTYPAAEYPAGQWDYQYLLRGELRPGRGRCSRRMWMPPSARCSAAATRRRAASPAGPPPSAAMAAGSAAPTAPRTCRWTRRC